MAKRKTMDEIRTAVVRRLRETQVELTIGQRCRRLVPPDRCPRDACGALMRMDFERDHDLIVARLVCWNGHEIYCPTAVMA